MNALIMNLRVLIITIVLMRHCTVMVLMIVETILMKRTVVSIEREGGREGGRSEG